VKKVRPKKDIKRRALFWSQGPPFYPLFIFLSLLLSLQVGHHQCQTIVTIMSVIVKITPCHHYCHDGVIVNKSSKKQRVCATMFHN